MKRYRVAEGQIPHDSSGRIIDHWIIDGEDVMRVIAGPRLCIERSGRDVQNILTRVKIGQLVEF